LGSNKKRHFYVTPNGEIFFNPCSFHLLGLNKKRHFYLTPNGEIILNIFSFHRLGSNKKPHFYATPNGEMSYRPVTPVILGEMNGTSNITKYNHATSECLPLNSPFGATIKLTIQCYPKR